MNITTFVLAKNSEGSPELILVSVLCSEDDYSYGVHYERAERVVSNKGYDVVGVFDKNDPAAKAINESQIFVRLSA